MDVKKEGIWHPADSNRTTVELALVVTVFFVLFAIRFVCFVLDWMALCLHVLCRLC